MDATMTGTGKRSSTTAFAIIAGVFCLLHLLPTYLSSWLWIAGFVIMFLRMKNVLPAIGFAVLAVDRVVCMAVYGVIDVISILWTLIFLLAAVICFASLTNIMPMQREAFRRLWFLPAVLSAVKWVIAIVWTLHRDSRRILSYGFAEYLSSSGIISTLLQGVFITALMLFALLWAANPDGIPSKGTSKAYCNMALHILLLLFSCGIWYWIWNYRMTRDTNAVRDEAERNPVTKLLLCMFIPFYGIYWTYKTAQRIDKMAWDRNIPSSTAALCLIMEFFLPIVPPIVMQDKMNAVAAARDPQPVFYRQPAAQPQAAEARQYPQSQQYATQAQQYPQSQPQPVQAPEYPQNQPSAAAQDIAEKLRTYKALLDVGAISQKEFEEKRRQLLGL